MQAPRLPSFFNSIRHKRFDFATRYYSERNEKIENIKTGENKIDLKEGNNIKDNLVQRKIRLTLIFAIIILILTLLLN
tara:strand:- start:248 stop:481 length:234 start_codon:yes stop_codon:yes gene_type:complete